MVRGAYKTRAASVYNPPFEKGTVDVYKKGVKGRAPAGIGRGFMKVFDEHIVCTFSFFEDPPELKGLCCNEFIG